MSKSMKPIPLDFKKASKPVLTEVDLAQWREVIISNIKAEADWVPFLKSEWKASKVENRGLDGDNVAARSRNLDRMITFVATYAPSALFKEITQRSTSLAAVWEVIRKWAGVRASSSKHLTYSRLKHSFDPAGNVSHQEFFYNLRDAKENCLVTRAGGIKVDGEVLTEDEELTPCLEGDIIVDWLYGIGGQPLVEHIFRIYSKDLETTSLKDLQERISDNLPSLITEPRALIFSQPAHLLNWIKIAFINYLPGTQYLPRRIMNRILTQCLVQ